MAKKIRIEKIILCRTILDNSGNRAELYLDVEVYDEIFQGNEKILSDFLYNQFAIESENITHNSWFNFKIKLRTLEDAMTIATALKLEFGGE